MSSGYHWLNFIAIDLQLYKMFKITRLVFFQTHCMLNWSDAGSTGFTQMKGLLFC